ncbi:Predicted metalloprotease, contains C-terminal PDZ domain [Flavobacteriaceae bacterium MAR_2010_188]|nr:Predicted metalloprotease, contains C-terminal PDZ domain [Flavobacteriaceae bacterium MAR_2010_188]
MRYIFSVLLIFAISNTSTSQTSYTISFPAAVHHEAEIEAVFKNIKNDTATFKMSRSSPGRYALHEFAKNVYSVSATDLKDKPLTIFRTDPYSWHVTGHKGEIKVKYTLFANHADGTYSQIDETHAHLNMPATFMFMDELKDSKYQLKIMPRQDLNWKIATQLQKESDTDFLAEDLQYFMDSPIEISDLRMRTFEISDNDRTQTIEVALHDSKASDSDFEQYSKYVEDIVKQEQAVFGELPTYDFGKYTFLACFMPQNSGDAMEHRNSTSLSSTRSLADGGVKGNLGSAAHEFFHCWNVERIRPQALEPFDFSEANMSGELWFAEGFTNYFDGLSMVRAGVITQEDFIQGMGRTFNFVWTSSGREYFNPIEMSYQAPFVDAARSVDATNRNNTFISYYSYGDMLGLALDLALRKEGKDLDSFMQLVWNTYGKKQQPYTVDDIHKSLSKFSSQKFSDDYFNNYIYKSEMPDFMPLFENVGLKYEIEKKPGFGVSVKDNKVLNNPTNGSTAYKAGIQENDKIIRLNETSISNSQNPNTLISNMKVGDSINITLERYGKLMTIETEVLPETNYKIELIPDEGLNDEQRKNKLSWLGKK